MAISSPPGYFFAPHGYPSIVFQLHWHLIVEWICDLKSTLKTTNGQHQGRSQISGAEMGFPKDSHKVQGHKEL